MMYISRPVTREACRWNEANIHTGWPGGPEITYTAAEIIAWVTNNGGEAELTHGPSGPKITIWTVNDCAYVARPGHYVVRRGGRDFVVCHPETFQKDWLGD